jgi:hypothetical protein
VPRRRSLPARIQERLSRYYRLDSAPPVDDFLRPADGDARESLLIRETGGELELALHLPREAMEGGAAPGLDVLCQVVEGVSHFLYVAERARRRQPATQLELELQAEIDKYLLLAQGQAYSPERSRHVRARLFERVTFTDPAGTETGDRYRMANELAARFAGRLEEVFARRGLFEEMSVALRRFYWAGQTEKIEMARAA